MSTINQRVLLSSSLQSYTLCKPVLQIRRWWDEGKKKLIQWISNYILASRRSMYIIKQYDASNTLIYELENVTTHIKKLRTYTRIWAMNTFCAFSYRLHDSVYRIFSPLINLLVTYHYFLYNMYTICMLDDRFLYRVQRKSIILRDLYARLLAFYFSRHPRLNWFDMRAGTSDLRCAAYSCN